MKNDFLTIRIEKELAKKFKKHLIDKEISYTKWLEQKILEELDKKPTK